MPIRRQLWASITKRAYEFLIGRGSEFDDFSPFEQTELLLPNIGACVTVVLRVTTLETAVRGRCIDFCSEADEFSIHQGCNSVLSSSLPHGI